MVGFCFQSCESFSSCLSSDATKVLLFPHTGYIDLTTEDVLHLAKFPSVFGCSFLRLVVLSRRPDPKIGSPWQTD